MRAVAAIDLGTNSSRLLIHNGDKAIERLMTITRLGEGVEATGQLADEAIERVVAAMSEFREAIERHEVGLVRAVATSACRDASNREQFFDSVEAVLGVRPEILSGVEEGRLSFSGATADLDATAGPFLIADIGGGSTEFVYGTIEVEAAVSLDIGCVRLTESYIENDPPRPEELVACLSITEAHLDDVARAIPGSFEARTFVGLAGTVTTAAAVEIGLAEYDRDRIHHYRLSKAAIEDVYRTLVTESYADRIHNPGLEEARADVIVAGMCILVQIMRFFGFEECLVSESDILDGIASSLLDS